MSSFLSANAQTITEPSLEVKYEYYDNFRSVELVSTLILNSNQSIFKTNMSKAGSPGVKREGNKVIIGAKYVDTYIYRNRSDNQLIDYVSFAGKPIAVRKKPLNLIEI